MSTGSNPGQSSDPHVAAVQRAMVPFSATPVSVAPDRVEQALRVAARARKQMGTGIDPAVVAACADDFDQAIKTDPACVPAYQGLARAAQVLASSKPDYAQELLAHALRWVRVAMVRVPLLKGDPEMLDLEVRLQMARSKARSRPRPSGPSVRVQVKRDAEGRAIRSPTARRENPRFRPDSEELRALVPEVLVGHDGEGGPEVPRWAGPTVGLLFLIVGILAGVYALDPIMVGAILAMGFLLTTLPLLVAIGRRTRGWAPGIIAVAAIAVTMGVTDRLLAPPPTPERVVAKRFGPQVDQLYVDLRHQLRLPTSGDRPRRLLGLEQLALVEETGDTLRPLKVSPLHPRLSRKLRSDPGQQVAFLAVLRRYQSPAGPLLVVWVLDPGRNAVSNRAVFGYEALPVLEQRAVAWLESQGQIKPE